MPFFVVYDFEQPRDACRRRAPLIQSEAHATYEAAEASGQAGLAWCEAQRRSVEEFAREVRPDRPPGPLLRWTVPNLPISFCVIEANAMTDVRQAVHWDACGSVPVRVTYDPEADAAMIYLTTLGLGEAAVQHLCDDEVAAGYVILDFSTEGRLLGVEVLNASKTRPPEVLARAERI